MMRNFVETYGASAFTCRFLHCPKATDGFTSSQLRDSHEAMHQKTYRCAYQSCFSFGSGFTSKRAWTQHNDKWHREVEEINSLLDHMKLARVPRRRSHTQMGENQTSDRDIHERRASRTSQEGTDLSDDNSGRMFSTTEVNQHFKTFDNIPPPITSPWFPSGPTEELDSQRPSLQKNQSRGSVSAGPPFQQEMPLQGPRNPNRQHRFTPQECARATDIVIGFMKKTTNEVNSQRRDRLVNQMTPQELDILEKKGFDPLFVYYQQLALTPIRNQKIATNGKEIQETLRSQTHETPGDIPSDINGAEAIIVETGSLVFQTLAYDLGVEGTNFDIKPKGSNRKPRVSRAHDRTPFLPHQPADPKQHEDRKQPAPSTYDLEALLKNTTSDDRRFPSTTPHYFDNLKDNTRTGESVSRYDSPDSRQSIG